jgi:hypothetical protein
MRQCLILTAIEILSLAALIFNLGVGIIVHSVLINVKNPDKLSSFANELHVTFSGIDITFLNQSRTSID